MGNVLTYIPSVLSSVLSIIKQRWECYCNESCACKCKKGDVEVPEKKINLKK